MARAPEMHVKANARNCHIRTKRTEVSAIPNSTDDTEFVNIRKIHRITNLSTPDELGLFELAPSTQNRIS
jgi:hypothetical protein